MGNNIKETIKKRKNMVFLLIFFVLLIANILLYYSFFKHYFGHHIVNVPFAVVNNLLTMGAAIIIFGFISTRLPQFRDLRDSSIYEMGYLVIIGIFSILISYFNQSTHSGAFFMPFLNMFKVLSVVLIFMLLATKTRFFYNIMHRKATRRDLFFAFVFFSVLGCLASRYTIPVNNSFANVRNLIIMIASLFGGPYVGIPACIVSAGFRFFEGGTTALPCSLATVIAGFLGSLIYILNDGKFPKGRSVVILMFLYVGFEMALIIWLTPAYVSVVYINDIYPLMLFGGVLGMILCVMIFREVKPENKLSYEELKIMELENTLEEYEIEIEKLHDDVELLKEKNDIE
ncbi:MAG: serine/threonine protein phosphatase [Methanobrevibacter thaueri]|uniref:Serine/threonine protein phosphatase n=1 Tax=Methanobrevibacter thaueri TaxID=190975 RepID=A0A8T3V349_9EURY|nr:LytS/YhcK type 5TM receptor domain-containing protein [Methanobrevibacter thaueri]MBE6500942.1 serine/threonine protein phosphatase [Methanobrevibacter thaueri]